MISSQPEGTCPSGKKRYGHQLSARKKLLEFWKKAERGADRSEWRAYFCDRCQGWHLTSHRDEERKTA